MKTSSVISRKAVMTFSASLMALSMVSTAHAQQREIVNPSFEQFNPSGTNIFAPNNGTVPPGNNSFVIASDDYFPGWISTNNQIEIWHTDFQNRFAQEGDYLAELNPTAPVGLYQEICLINGESLSWDFYHAARTSNGAPTNQTVAYEVISLDGNYNTSTPHNQHSD